MGMIIFIAAGAAAAWAERAMPAHATTKAHVILALAILVPAAIVWTLLRRRAERAKAQAAAPRRPAYSSFGQQGRRG